MYKLWIFDFCQKYKQNPGDPIGNKIANKLKKTSQQNSWKTIESEAENLRVHRKILKEIYIYIYISPTKLLMI